MFFSDFVGNSYEQWESNIPIIASVFTGFGKTTFVFDVLLKEAIRRNEKIIYLCNRRSTRYESVYFNDGEIECYADGYSVNNEYVIDGDYNNNLSLAAGRKATAKVYFEVDIDEVDSLQLEYADALWVIK